MTRDIENKTLIALYKVAWSKWAKEAFFFCLVPNHKKAPYSVIVSQIQYSNYIQ